MIKIDVSELKDVSAFLKEAKERNSKSADEAVDKIGYAIEASVKDEAIPHRITGQYHRSIRYQRLGSGSGKVYSVDRVAEWLEEGTKPRVIYPYSARVLVFESAGVTVFTPVVRHPGTPAYKIFQTGLDNAEGTINSIIASYSL